MIYRITGFLVSTDENPSESRLSSVAFLTFVALAKNGGVGGLGLPKIPHSFMDGVFLLPSVLRTRPESCLSSVALAKEDWGCPKSWEYDLSYYRLFSFNE
jgi:hypothetical protein